MGEGGATSEGVRMLRRAGDYHVVGYGENIDVPTIDIVNSEINFIGNLVGSYNDLCALMVLAARGADALVFRGADGLDELSVTGPSTVWVVRGGTVSEESFDPASLGLPYATIEDLRGADAAYNAGVARALLDGATGPVRDAVLLNAAGALVAAAGIGAGIGSGGLADAFPAALKRAAAAIDTGAAQDTLDRWVALSTRLAASR